MKQPRILLLGGLLFCFLNVVQAQKISLSVHQKPLEQVFAIIQEQTELTVSYSRPTVNPNKIVSIEATNEELSSVLARLFQDQPIGFEITDRGIFLNEKRETPSTQRALTITGTVLDERSEPIIGANIKEQGSSTGTITDFDGKFTLNVSADATLQISYIGYLTQSVKVMGRTSFSVTLQEDNKALDEVVVIGYGTQKKSSLTGSVASISTKETGKQMTSNVASALQGRTTGVEIVQQGGVAGADVNIVIRGAASFGATEPLYVIDGAFSNNGLTSLNPNDIESIEILKDGAAAAIYGSRAANGVVLITTKKGKKGVPVVEIDASYAFQKPTKVLDFLNASEWRAFANKVADNSGLPHAPENDNPTNPSRNTEWEKLWLQYAPIYNVNASISGGGENSNYSTSIGYFDQTGMTIFSGYKRYNFRINSGFKKGIFSLSENLSITHRHRTPTTAFNIALPTLPLYDDQGRLTSGGPDYYINPEDGKEQNKLAPLYYTKRYDKNTDIIGGLTATLDLYSGLKYKLSVSGNYSVNHGYTHTPQYYTKYNADGTPDKDYGNTRNTISESRGEEMNYTIDNLLTYNKKVNKHTFDALLGASWMREFSRGMSLGTIADLGATNITGFNSVDGKISASDANAALMSYFARLNYDYSDTYLLSLSIRRDESSKFHKDQRVGYFPSVSAGWNVHAEPWFENKIMDKFKLRASYGELGANFLAPYNFDAIAYGPIPYVIGGTRYVTGRAAYLKSKDLKWETSKSTNFGVEMAFFNNSLTFSAEYFIKKNVDLLAQIDLNLSSGQIFEINSSREKPYVNTASVENKGWEFMVGYRKQFANDFSIDINGNLSTLQNKVLALGTNVQPITSGAYSSFFNDAPSITKPGYPIGAFYGYTIDGFDAQGNFIFSDSNNDGIVNADDKVVLGSPIPDFSYGLNTTFTYKQFDLTMFWQGVSGNKIFNAKKYTYYFDYSNNVVRDVLNAWTPENQKTNIPIMKTQNTNGGNSLPSSFYIEDGSYLRLKNLQLGYSLSTKVLKRISFNHARVYVGVQNLLTFTRYSGSDPEASSNVLFSRGIDNNSYPNARTVTMGFNLSF